MKRESIHHRGTETRRKTKEKPAGRIVSASSSPARGGGGHEAGRLREIEKEIFARRPEHAINPSLERISALVTLLGDPHFY